MEALLHTFIAFFADNGVTPPEVQPADRNREGTYLFELPTKPDNVVAFNLYGQILPTLQGKGFQLVHLHIVIRNKSAVAARQMAQSVFDFVYRLADPEKDYIQEIDGNFFIFDIRNGPQRLQQDEHQNSLWSISIPIKCKL